MADKQVKRIAEFIAPLRVEPGATVDLGKDFDPRYRAGLQKKEGVELLRTGVSLLAEYQARLAAQDTYGVLLCLQALDAGGKDGTIRHVMSGVNPQGVQVTSFKVPSAEELPRLPVAVRPPAARPVATSRSSTGRTMRRSWSSGSTPRSSTGSGCRVARRVGTCGTAATARSTTGSAISPTTGSTS